MLSFKLFPVKYQLSQKVQVHAEQDLSTIEPLTQLYPNGWL